MAANHMVLIKAHAANRNANSTKKSAGTKSPAIKNDRKQPPP